MDSMCQVLLNWCKYHTNGYSNVSVTNFTTSWKNGLAFNAIIHRYNPELIDFHQLDPNNEYYNNHIAFKLAEDHFGIKSLLHPKDLALTSCTEKLNIIAYVSQLYYCFKEMEPKGGPEINRFENTENYNSDMQSLSGMSSLVKLAEMKCSVCRKKVFLLERYLACDKLYHRKCYRDFQIRNIDNDSDLIDIYLNIYGERQSTMNKDTYVHPLYEAYSYNELNHLTNTLHLKEGDLNESEISDQKQDLYKTLSSSNKNDSENNSDCNLGILRNEALTTEFYRIKDDHSANERDYVTIFNDNLAPSIVERTSETIFCSKNTDKELPYQQSCEVSSDVNTATCLNLFGPKDGEISFNTTSKANTLNNNDTTLDTINDYQKGSDMALINVKCVHIPVESKYTCYSEFKCSIADLNEKQSDIESRGREIQQKLYEVDPSIPEYTDVVNSWLSLAEEKDKIMYEENALHFWLEDIKLQEKKKNIESQIRSISNGNKGTEDKLIKKLLETVNKRSKLVDIIHENHLKRITNSNSRTDALEKICTLKEIQECVVPTRTEKKRKSFWRKFSKAS